MKNMLGNKWLILVLRLVLGVIFVAASISKLADITKFISTVASYGILDYHLSAIYGFAVAVGELILGISLLLGVFVKLAAALCIPLTISFATASIYAIAHRAAGPCGCFGTFLKLSHPLALSIDVLITAAAVILLFNREKQFLSVMRFAERLNISSAAIKWTGRIAFAGIIIFYAAFVPIRVSQYTQSQTYAVLTAAPEIISIPGPLGGDVDAALAKNKPILLEFYVDACHLCQNAAPIVLGTAADFGDKITLMRLNYYDYYQNSALISGMHVFNIPSVLVITGKNNDGNYIVRGHFEGVIPQDTLTAILQLAVSGK